MSDYLFVRPADDSAAVDVATWGQAVRLKVAPPTSVADLAGLNASRASVDAELALRPRHLFWFGHGRDDALIAAGVALLDSSNIGGLAGGIVVAIACYSAVQFGPDAVQMPGVSAFVGFDDEFGFPATAPLPMAHAVINGLDCLFSAGHDIACAVLQLTGNLDRARIEYKTNGAALGLSASESRTAWLYAKSNRHSLQLHGDSTSLL